jgi:hypothetical protein
MMERFFMLFRLYVVIYVFNIPAQYSEKQNLDFSLTYKTRTVSAGVNLVEVQQITDRTSEGRTDFEVNNNYETIFC